MKIAPALAILFTSACLLADGLGRTMEALEKLPLIKQNQESTRVDGYKDGEILQTFIPKKNGEAGSHLVLRATSLKRKENIIEIDLLIPISQGQPAAASRIDGEDQRTIAEVMDFLGIKQFRLAVVDFANDTLRSNDGKLRRFDLGSGVVRCQIIGKRLMLQFLAPEKKP
jgi:hypothetical protein